MWCTLIQKKCGFKRFQRKRDSYCTWISLRSNDTRGGSRTAATSKMEHIMTIVCGWKPWTIIRKSSILDVAAVLDPPLNAVYLDAYVHNLTKEVLAFKMGEGGRPIGDLRIMKFTGRFSQITFRNSRPQVVWKKNVKIPVLEFL